MCNSVGHLWSSLPVLKISPCFLLGKEVEMALEGVHVSVSVCVCVCLCVNVWCV